MSKPPGILNELFTYERKKRYWTQQYIADQLGILDDRTVGRWERGEAVPRSYLDKLVALFGKSAKALGFAHAGDISFWYVPDWQSTVFTGREEILLQLHDIFRAHITNQEPRLPLALCGLGGVGKTQIAREYAYRCRKNQYGDNYHTILWLRAASRREIKADIEHIVSVLDLPEKDAANTDQRVRAFTTWLTDPNLTRWLLILDDVEDLSILEEFVPSGFKGQVLLTTRSQHTGRLVQPIPVKPLHEDDGAELLLRRASIKQATVADITIARSLSAELGGLPLALDQAGAYIEGTERVSLAAYKQQYQERRRELLAQRGWAEKKIPSQHPTSVVATFGLAFAKVREQYPPADDLLHFCAFLQPDGMPEEVLLQATDRLRDTHIFHEAIATLKDFSLITYNPSAKTFSMHRLVQAVLGDDMASDVSKHWRGRVVRALHAAFPVVDFQNWPQCERLVPHALGCVGWTERELAPVREAAELFHKVGLYLRARGQYSDAEPFLERALAIWEQCAGTDHRDTATICHDVAGLYWLMGKYDLAESLAKRALAIREQCLGPDHPDVARTLNGLAALYDTQGNPDKAEPLYLRALAIRKRYFGDAHLETAWSLNDLGILYREQGKYDQAEPYLQQAATLKEQLLGADHPDTALSLTNLGDLYRRQGKYDQAIRLLKRGLRIRKRQLGAQHPNTAESHYAVAKLYHQQGKDTLAEIRYLIALALQEEQLGKHHPETEEIREDYTAFLCSRGRDADAVAVKAADES